ncbi:hypothetical protein M758_6G144200 [Ceratodon purpureus]|uniref:Uncharacterized protein n=1 Tax=Ceratodon purpureus TaxID=3225 RepID=A0A8T0HIX8_CERPU|nr:hypothetical protein KC19_6G149900 [Ceratodon purpureus]KAG0614008.1 hypothetical protein M758_6G144200 [Ceratodon purpureus]
MATYERQDSNGLGFADQYDKYFDEDVQGSQGGRKNSKMAKVKEAASHSVEKTKSAATASAHKVKSGTSSSLRWIKEKVQRKN